MNNMHITPIDAAALDLRSEIEIVEAMHAGEHLWLTSLTFRVKVPVESPQILDPENVFGSPATGCLLCGLADQSQRDTLCDGHLITLS